MNNLEDWLSYIGSLHPKTIFLGLDRVKQVAAKLSFSKFDCPVITVAGTNGKGSCVKLLESILIESGYAIAAYTSPHLLSFNERIRINGNNIDDDSLCLAFQAIENARGEIALTFFEYTTLAAFWLLKQKPLDGIILEVGLGGRLDAVNFIDADLAIITSIGIDHTEWLGSTREAIASEKAGIFRPNQLAVCGDKNPPTSLQEKAKKLNTELFCIGKDFDYREESTSWTWWCSKLHLDNLPLPKLSINNVATVLMAVTLLQGKFNVQLEAIKKVIAMATLPGRLQEIKEKNPCILDVAHNPDASELLAVQLKQHYQNQSYIAVVGMLADKDIRNTLKPLIPLVSEWHLGSLNVDRGATSRQLASYLQDFGNLKCYTHDDVSKAFIAASNALPSTQKILVFGSFYTVAEVLNLLQIDRTDN